MRLFIDTSAFYALEDASDSNHQDAQAVQERLRKERPNLFTTNHVVDEAITLIGSKLSPSQAVRFARRLFSSRIVAIVRTDEEVEQAALGLYERLQDPRLSFTDCLSFSVMRGLGITTVFAYDRDFERAGFELLQTKLR